MGMEVQPKTFDRENLKFGLKFSVLATDFGVSGSILTKHFPATCREAGVITCI